MPKPPLLSLQAPAVWFTFLALALGAAVLAFKLLFLVEPGLNVGISFSRQQAVDAAATFQRERFPQLSTRRSAAAFLSDRDFQNYVELEAGGFEAYQALISSTDAATHVWHVRAFTPGQKHELNTIFSPRGELVAFSYLLPEDEGSVALDDPAARALAEAGARELLGQRFAAYTLIATRQQNQSSGRVDHEFTYEHRTLQPGDARLRLTLKVAGAQLVAIDISKFTPEAFRQRFGELRALNTQLSQLANGLMLAVFGLGGLLGGGIWLYRRHQLQFRKALLPAFIISLGLAAAQLANLPIQWMGYQTQTAEQSFILQQVAQAGVVVVFASLLFGIVFAVAEGLTRHACAQQPRLWGSLQYPVAGSQEMVGRVLGGYAWTGFFLLYALGFLLFSSRMLGWWQPSSLNVDPNVLASWRPALAPIFSALQAGTWEECFFRAIPLSLALLLDRHYDTGRKLTLIMLVFQALVFGAAHADYPQLPGYSRVVELFIPALVFGLVFLRFGLVPCILTHFLYDLLLMSMPIFLADDSSLWLDRLLVILAAAAPLLAVLLAWRRQGCLQPLPPSACNGEQPAPEPQLAAAATPVTTLLPAAEPFGIQGRVLVVAGLVSLCLFATFTLRPPSLDWPLFSINRAEAAQLAEAALAERGAVLQGEWRRSIQIQTAVSTGLSFAWQQSGRSEVQQLLGSYIETPHWVIVWRRFDGPVEERAETWQVRLTPDGSLLALGHQLPEGRSGASLNQEAAEALARDWLDGLGWTPAGGFKLQAVAETKRPARSDWEVTLEDAFAYAQADAIAVSVVRIAGDEVTAWYRSLDLPEAWTRARSDAASRRQPWGIASTVLSLLLVGIALSTFLRRHSGRRFNLRAAGPWLALMLLPQAGLTWLRFDSNSMAFQTTMGWNAQVAVQIGGLILVIAVLGTVVTMAVQALYAERPHAGANWKRDSALGFWLATCVMGVYALGGLLLPSQEPSLPVVADWASAQPALAVLLNSWRGLASSLSTLILALGFVRFIQKAWQFWLLVATAAMFWISGALAQPDLSSGLTGPLPTLASVLLGYALIRRGQLGVALMLAGTLVVFRQWNLVHAAYPGAWLHAIAAAGGSAAALCFLLWHWHAQVADSGQQPGGNSQT
jgi:hypothetical protein